MEYTYKESLVIRVDASTAMGIGHLMRCLALAQAWKDNGGQVIFITTCQNEGLLQRLREERFDIHLLTNSYPDANDWAYTKDILAAHPGAWMVLDGYHFDEVYQQWVKEAGHRLLVVDDMARLKHYYADIVLNQDLGADKLDYSCEPNTRLLIGTRYVLLRREFLTCKGWKREIPEVARRVLITLGGGDLENHTLSVIQALQKVNIPGVEATVVIGASNPHADTLAAAIKQGHIPTRLIRNVKNMPELMAWADVAVSAGGGTVWETAFMGLPCLILVVAENQRLTISLVEARSLSLILEARAGAVTEEQIADKIVTLLLDRKRRLHFSKALTSLVDGEGSQRVLNIMF